MARGEQGRTAWHPSKSATCGRRSARLPVIHGVDIDIEDGEFVVLVGPSGCGKSTLLRMIAGLEDITGGEIAIGERVVNDVPPKERDIAMVFQNYALYPHMTVRRQHGLLAEAARRAEGRDRRSASSEAADDPRPRRSCSTAIPRQLSGGQRQRVAMGRAIVRDPQVFLFDEPLSNLDAKLRVQMRTEIKELHQRLKTTTIYVTHDQIEAMTMADKIVVMNDGIVEQVGAPLELYDQPGQPVRRRLHRLAGDELPQGHGSSRTAAPSFERPSGVRLPIGAAPAGSRRPAGGLRHPARALHLADDGAGGRGRRGRADRLGDPGRRQDRRPGAGRACSASASRPGRARRSGIAPDPALVHLFDGETGARLN